MNRIRILLISGAAALLAVPVLAQQQGQVPPGPGPVYWHGPMWHGGWHGGMVLGPFVLLLALIGFVTVIAGLVRFFGYGRHRQWRDRGPYPGAWRGRANDILEERFARGEIDKAEFEEKRKLLGR